MDRVILYHALLPRPLSGSVAATLPCWTAALAYALRSSLPPDSAARARTLLGLALALRGLGTLLGRDVAVRELRFAPGEKPRVAAAVDFSIAHAGEHVAVAARTGRRIGLDIEDEADSARARLRTPLPQWLARESVLKAAGLGLRHQARVTLLEHGAQLDGTHYTLRTLRLAPACPACLASDGSLDELEVRYHDAADVAELLAA